jgi:hypothetical protein
MALLGAFWTCFELLALVWPLLILFGLGWRWLMLCFAVPF